MKPTWSKIYSGPGYPIDPAKEEARIAKIVSEDFVVKMLSAQNQKPNPAYLQFAELIQSGHFKATMKPSIDPSYSCVMKPPEKLSVFPECENIIEAILSLKAPHEIVMFDAEIYALISEEEEKILNNKHVKRCMAIYNEDFKSRLMAIEVKERGAIKLK